MHHFFHQVAVAAISSMALTAALVHSMVASPRNDRVSTDLTELWGQGSLGRQRLRVEGIDLGRLLVGALVGWLA